MKFGVRLPHFKQVAEDPTTTPSNIAEVAKRAEVLGFDSVWVGDHLVPTPETVAQFGTVWYEAMTTLAFAAALTERVRLGTSILVAPYRQPMLMAKMLSTLDALSGGRVDAGFGTGWLEPEFRALGLDNFAQRGKVTDDYLMRMKAAWRGELPDAPGEGTLLFAPKPVQRGGVPIWIGGNSRRAARRVVELGDAWQLVRPTFDDFHTSVDHLHRLCEQAGRDPGDILLGVEQPMSVTDGRVRDVPFLGSAERVADQLGRFAAGGATHFLFDMFYSAPELDAISIEQMLDGMERFAAEVMPLVVGSSAADERLVPLESGASRSGSIPG